MTQQDDKAADAIALLDPGAFDKAVDKARLGAGRMTTALDGLTAVEPERLDRTDVVSLSHPDPTRRHRLTWTGTNRPNLIVGFTTDGPTPGSDERYEVHLPDGSSALSPGFGPDSARDLATALPALLFQALERQWQPPRPDETRARVWAVGLRALLRERLADCRERRMDVDLVSLSTPWSPIMVSLVDGDGAVVPSRPLADVAAGDPVLLRAGTIAPHIILALASGDFSRRRVELNSYGENEDGDPVGAMRALSVVLAETAA